MTARNFLVLIGSQVLTIVGGLVMYFAALLFVGDIFSAYTDTVKLLTLLLLGIGFLVLGLGAASYIAQVNILSLSIVFLIASAIGSFTLMPISDALSIIVAVFISVFSIIIIVSVVRIGKGPVNMYAESISVSNNTVYYLLAVEIVIVEVTAFYYVFPL